MLYWPEFNFEFRLDIQRLLPHLAAIETYQESAANRVLPPQWREETAAQATGDRCLDQPEGKQARPGPIAVRKQHLLMTNSSAALAWVRQRFVPGSAPLSLADILMLHRMVADESGTYNNKAGVMRIFGVQVGRREVGGMHVGAPAERLPRLMELYVQFINGERLRTFPAVVHALVAHFFFTTIHPFDDGNGRLCRLTSAAILFRRGYNGHGFYALSNYFYQNEIKYHTLLHQAWKQPLPFNLTEFVAFGMEGLAIELQGIRSFVKMKLNRVAEREILTPALRRKVETRSSRLTESWVGR